MTTNQYRHPGEGEAHPAKEKGRTGNDQATHTQNTHQDSTTDDGRPLYAPLRGDALDRKRGEA